jgi:predicted acyltransferase
MLLGLLAGNALKATTPDRQKVRFFLGAGVCLVAASLVLHWAGINPIVKRIWTPAWVLFSGGVCFLFLCFFYWAIDMRGRGKGAFVLKVIGVNSIAAYVIADGFSPFLASSLFIHLGQRYHLLLGAPYATLLKGALVLLLEWLILHWMYKQKIFVKI